MEKRKRSIDMLSGLPDEILFHILSFLPTKLSVSTSVLAKRWKFLWTHVSNLEFHENDFKVKKKKQLDIINRVIILHQAKILNTFKLSELKGCAYQLETLIIYPITRGVRNLYLELGYHCEDDIVCTVPRLLFTCKTLVDLKVVNCGRIPSTGEFFLPSLKKLNLTYVEYESDESLPHLLSGCPVLEELIVDDVHRDEQKYSGCFTISSPTIKTLNVNFSIGIEYNPQKTLIIDVPALIYLKVICYDLEYVKSLRKPMTSLSEAEITFDGNSHRCHIDCKEHCRSIEFLSCLSHVRYLKFSSPDAEMLFDIVGTGPITKFVNLTKLELDLPFNWHHVVKFLEVADNLEVLFVSEFGIFNLPYIEVGSFYLLVYHFFGHRVNAREMLPFKEPKRVPPCMLSRLRTVRMYYFSACQDSLDIVRYILMNALVLERMEIDPLFKSSEEKFDALQRIALFERASKSCKVAFNTDEIVRDMIKLEDAKKCRFYSFE